MILFSTLLTAFFVRRIRSQSLHVNTLEEALLYGTKSIVRPVIDTTTQVNVTFDITLHQVVEVQETENLITCQYWVRQSWTNQLLTWNPNHWNGKSTLEEGQAAGEVDFLMRSCICLCSSSTANGEKAQNHPYKLRM